MGIWYYVSYNLYRKSKVDILHFIWCFVNLILTLRTIQVRKNVVTYGTYRYESFGFTYPLNPKLYTLHSTP